MIESLFPLGSRADLPIVAVTGTNGKTTTSRMLVHILQMSGHRPGLACSDGLYVKDRNLWPGERGGLSGHSRLLERNDIDTAVLETTLGSLYRYGLAFPFCDVGVCLNVTPDHLDAGRIETLEELAAMKRSLLERARNAVVLNADDPRCVAMLPYVSARRICLVSANSSVQEVREFGGETVDVCLVEDRREVVLWRDREVFSLGAIKEMPAAHSGRVSHNLTNAMHAMAAASYMGVAPKQLRAAMQTFETRFETTPGRWNIHDNGRFRVIMDFVHNVDGFRKLSDCVDQEEVAGRRILMYSLPGDRSDELILAAAAQVAGHFDHFVCRPHPRLHGRELHEVPAMMKKSLMAAGVAEENISLPKDPVAAIGLVLAMGNPGDLVVMRTHKNEFESMWQAITEFDEQPPSR